MFKQRNMSKTIAKAIDTHKLYSLNFDSMGIVNNKRILVRMNKMFRKHDTFVAETTPASVEYYIWMKRCLSMLIKKKGSHLPENFYVCTGTLFGGGTNSIAAMFGEESPTSLSCRTVVLVQINATCDLIHVKEIDLATPRVFHSTASMEERTALLLMGLAY